MSWVSTSRCIVVSYVINMWEIPHQKPNYYSIGDFPMCVLLTVVLYQTFDTVSLPVSVVVLKKNDQNRYRLVPVTFSMH